MRNACVIAAKEIRQSFSTPLFYVVSAAFVLLAGFMFFSILSQYNTLLQQAALKPELTPSLNDQVVAPFYQVLEVVLIFLAPILTMRMFAEERRGGTYELLMTAPLSAAEIVWGKYLGVAVLMSATICCAFIFPGMLLVFSDPEVLPVLLGFCGLLLFGLAYASAGIAVASCTSSQTLAGVVSLAVLLLLHVIDAPSAEFGGIVPFVLSYLSPANHAQNLQLGIVDSVDLMYFASFIAAGLFLATRVLEAERWR